MKSKLLLLISFFACQTIFAQTTPGIAVQGIARDANKAALVDELLTFTFEIQEPDGTPKYTETEEIRTDPYGVFSHIIGNGTSQGSGLFGEIPFGQSHMKLVISVTYDGETIKISDGPFQYAPYAKSAANGVPTGTIVAFIGQEADIPKGWILCDGRSLTTIDFSQNLRNLIGDNAPDLRGFFLRGADKNGDLAFENNVGPELGAVQRDTLESHNHSAGDDEYSLVTNTTGNHSHVSYIRKHFRSFEGAEGTDNVYQDEGSDADALYTDYQGNHNHEITGFTGKTGGIETRPVNYGVNYIIKL